MNAVRTEARGGGRRMWLTMALAAAVVLLVLPAAASADSGSLASLRGWGAATGRLKASAGDAAVEQRLAALRALVPSAANALHADTQAARDAQLRASRRALDISLGPLPKRLTTDRAWFLFAAYQSELERLARLAGLERAATGRVMLVSTAQASAAQVREELAADSDDDGVIDTVEADDDNDGVPDAKDASDKGWGIPDAFRARPCVRVTEEIPDFRTVSAASGWLRAAVTARKCPRPVAARDVQAPRQLGKAGITVAGALVDSRTLTLKVRAKKSAKLVFSVRDGVRPLSSSRTIKVKAGKRSLKVKLNRVPSLGMHSLHITAKVGKKQAVGVEPVGVGQEPQPRTNPAGTPNASPVLPTPTESGGKIKDRDVPSGETPDNSTAPLATCPNQNTDSDGDAVPNCMEKVGFTFNVYNPGQATPKATHVVSDPHKSNTDDDAETHNGARYALSDGAEWANAQAGGVSNPSSKDSDSDGLTDVAETFRWGTNPAAPDTDSDARGPNRDQPPSSALYDGAEISAAKPTSPTLADTDGDGRTDHDEIVSLHSNPVVAQVPSFDVTREPDTGVQISIPVGSSSETATLRSDTTGTTKTDTSTNTTVDEVTTENKGLISGLKALKDLKNPVKPPKPTAAVRSVARPRFDFGDIASFATTAFDFASSNLFDDSSTKSTTMAVSESTQESAESTYQRTLKATETLGEKGTITATFRVQNTSDRSIEVRDVEVAVFTACVPLSARTASSSCTIGKYAPLGTLKQAIGGGQTGAPPIALGPHQTSAPINLQGTVDSALLQRLLGSPGGLVFRPSGGLYNPATGRNYVGEIGDTVNRRTAALTIDFDDGRVETHRVASSVDRSWGAPNEPVGTRVDTALESLGLKNTCPQTAAKACFAFGDAGFGRRALLAVGDPADHTKAAVFAKPVAADGGIPGAWVVFGRTQSALGTEPGQPYSIDLAAVRMAATDQLTLAYAADNDADGLIDRQERSLGTSDHSKDTDGDGAKDATHASDFFESRIGWHVTYPAGTTPRQVYSSPISCDLDADGLPDGGGAGCPQNNALGSELQQLTDPNNPDTNGDDLKDGAQENPLTPVGKPVKNATIPGDKMVATGGSAGPNGSWKLGNGGSIEPPAIGLCSAGEAGAACANATGYYRLRWVVTRDAGDSTAGLAYNQSDPIWARLTVSSPHKVTSTNPGTGRLETVEQEDQWMDARIQASEVRAEGVAQGYELYMHAVAPMQLAHINLRLQRGPGATVHSLTIASISRAEWLDGAYKNGAANPDFAGMAIPGRDFATHYLCGGTTAGPATKNPQGIQLKNHYNAMGPAGVQLPAGGYRVGFSYRGVTGSRPAGVRMGMTAGPAAPTAGEYCEYSGGFDSSPGLPDGNSLPDFDRARTPMTAGWVQEREIGDGGQRIINLLTAQNRAMGNVNFPVTVEQYPTDTGPVLLHVQVDRTPTPQRAMGTMAWSGFGISGTPPSEPTPLVALSKSSATVAPSFDGAAAVLPAGARLETPAFSAAGSQEIKWYVLHDAPVRLTHIPGGSTPVSDDYPGWAGSGRCGSIAVACTAATTRIDVTPSGSQTAKIGQLMVLKRSQ